MRHWRIIEVWNKRQQQWVEMSGLVDDEMLCGNPRCNRRPTGTNNGIPKYCSRVCYFVCNPPNQKGKKHERLYKQIKVINNHDLPE